MDIKVGPSTDLREDDSSTKNFQSYGNSAHPSEPASLIDDLYPNDSAYPPDDAPFEQTPMPRAARKGTNHPTGDPLSRLVLISLPFLVALAVLLNLAWKTIRPRVDGVIPLTGQVQARIEKAYVKPDNAVISPQSQPSGSSQLMCILPLGWSSHIVDPTESLFRLAVQYNITPEQLQAANCMGDETTVMPGQVIFVPPLPANTPTPTPEPTSTPTAVPTRVPFIPVTGENSASSDSDDEPNRPVAPPVQPTAEPPPPTAQPVPPTIAPTNPPPQQPKPTNPPPSVRPADPSPNQPVFGGGGNGNGSGHNGGGNGKGKGNGGDDDDDNKGKGKGKGGGKGGNNGNDDDDDGKKKGKGKGGGNDDPGKGKGGRGKGKGGK